MNFELNVYIEQEAKVNRAWHFTMLTETCVIVRLQNQLQTRHLDRKNKNKLKIPRGSDPAIRHKVEESKPTHLNCSFTSGQ